MLQVKAINLVSSYNFEMEKLSHTFCPSLSQFWERRVVVLTEYYYYHFITDIADLLSLYWKAHLLPPVFNLKNFSFYLIYI